MKVGGERLYRKARRGEEVDAPVRRVVIDLLDLVRFDAEAQEAELEVRCSSGTYVRQLVADLGELCGAGAYCVELERTEVGPFVLADADPERLLSALRCASVPAGIAADDAEADGVRHGRPVENPGGVGDEGSAVRLTADGALIAVARRRGDCSSPRPSSPDPPNRRCAG